MFCLSSLFSYFPPRTLIVLLQVLRRFFFGRPTNLANHDDAFSGVVLQEDFEAVDKVGAVERVATNTHAQGLSQANSSSLADGFVSQGAGPRHDADDTLLVNVSRHDANLARIRRDDARAVRSDKPGSILLEEGVLDTYLQDAHCISQCTAVVINQAQVKERKWQLKYGMQ